ncbi:HEAT repeat domain-containing protein [Streptomyces sp. NPDC058297]|uniref:HEAT repeat domain-containing protein n=1 Tax=unclassified Streptomyces TaxID=2593676 RepID=UPI0036E810BB
MADEINELAQSYGWPVVYEADRDFDKGKGREVNWGVTEQVVLGYLESHISNDCCIVAVGNSLELPERVVRQMDDDLEGEIESVADLLRAIQDEEDPRRLAQSLVRAGFGAPREFDQGFFDAFAKASREHDDYRVRDIAISSLVYMEWPEFKPLLEEIREHDPEDQVRARAAIVLRAYEAAGM